MSVLGNSLLHCGYSVPLNHCNVVIWTPSDSSGTVEAVQKMVFFHYFAITIGFCDQLVNLRTIAILQDCNFLRSATVVSYFDMATITATTNTLLMNYFIGGNCNTVGLYCFTTEW